ncbi:MAG TPA: STAS domain-containing protein [Acidimicrobiia bacterium]|nr:STAS domain-containing protein [Acidimicrobiia bacterium]
MVRTVHEPAAVEQRASSSWDSILKSRPLDARAAELVRWAAFLCPDADITDDRSAELAGALSEWAEHDSVVLHHAWAHALQRSRAGSLHRIVPALLWEAWQSTPGAGLPDDVDVRPPEATGRIEAWTADGARVLRPHDELDHVTSARLYDAIKHATMDHDRVVVDLSAVGFIDSSGLSALLVARRYAHRHGCDLEFVRPSRACRRAIDVTGLREVLGLSDAESPRHAAMV